MTLDEKRLADAAAAAHPLSMDESVSAAETAAAKAAADKVAADAAAAAAQATADKTAADDAAAALAGSSQGPLSAAELAAKHAAALAQENLADRIVLSSGLDKARKELIASMVNHYHDKAQLTTALQHILDSCSPSASATQVSALPSMPKSTAKSRSPEDFAGEASDSGTTAVQWLYAVEDFSHCLLIGPGTS